VLVLVVHFVNTDRVIAGPLAVVQALAKRKGSLVKRGSNWQASLLDVRGRREKSPSGIICSERASRQSSRPQYDSTHLSLPPSGAAEVALLGDGDEITLPRNHNLPNGLGLDIQMAVCALPGSLYTRKIPPEKEVAMLKQACTILLMAATASAQIPVPAFSPRQSGSKSVQRIVTYRRYWHLRRGTSEEVLIVVKPEDSANV